MSEDEGEYCSSSWEAESPFGTELVGTAELVFLSKAQREQLERHEKRRRKHPLGFRPNPR